MSPYPSKTRIPILDGNPESAIASPVKVCLAPVYSYRKATQRTQTRYLPPLSSLRSLRLISIGFVASLKACLGASFTATAADTTNNVTELASRPDYREWTVGVEAGSTGAGVFGSWRFYDYLGVRAGFDYFQWTENNLSVADFRYSTKLRFMSEPLTLDIYPWKAHSFHISVGMLFNQNQLTGTSSGFGPITFAGH